VKLTAACGASMLGMGLLRGGGVSRRPHLPKDH
jgi:hypothetical protein